MISEYWKCEQVSDQSTSKGDAVIEKDLYTKKRLNIFINSCTDIE